jgi:hypothetical protein
MCHGIGGIARDLANLADTGTANDLHPVTDIVALDRDIAMVLSCRKRL